MLDRTIVTVFVIVVIFSSAANIVRGREMARRLDAIDARLQSTKAEAQKCIELTNGSR